MLVLIFRLMVRMVVRLMVRVVDDDGGKGGTHANPYQPVPSPTNPYQPVPKHTNPLPWVSDKIQRGVITGMVSLFRVSTPGPVLTRNGTKS